MNTWQIKEFKGVGDAVSDRFKVESEREDWQQFLMKRITSVHILYTPNSGSYCLLCVDLDYLSILNFVSVTLKGLTDSDSVTLDNCKPQRPLQVKVLPGGVRSFEIEILVPGRQRPEIVWKIVGKLCVDLSSLEAARRPGTAIRTEQEVRMAALERQQETSIQGVVDRMVKEANRRAGDLESRLDPEAKKVVGCFRKAKDNTLNCDAAKQLKEKIPEFGPCFESFHDHLAVLEGELLAALGGGAAEIKVEPLGDFAVRFLLEQAIGTTGAGDTKVDTDFGAAYLQHAVSKCRSALCGQRDIDLDAVRSKIEQKLINRLAGQCGEVDGKKLPDYLAEMTKLETRNIERYPKLDGLMVEFLESVLSPLDYHPLSSDPNDMDPGRSHGTGQRVRRGIQDSKGDVKVYQSLSHDL